MARMSSQGESEYLSSGSDYRNPKLKEVKGFATDNITDFVVFIKILLILLESGDNMGAILSNMEKSVRGKFKPVMKFVKEEASTGKALSECFIESDFFPEDFCNIFEIGQESGKLKDALTGYSDFLRNTSKMQSMLRTALTYPIVVLTVVAICLIVVIFFVIPMFRDMLLEFVGKQALDEFTGLAGLLFSINAFLEPLGKALPIGLVIGFCFYMIRYGRRQLASLLEKLIPQLREVANDLRWGTWTMLGGVVQKAGVRISPMLEILGGSALPYEFLAKYGDEICYDYMKRRVAEGVALGECLEDIEAPDIVVSLVKASETEGFLAGAFIQLSEVFLGTVDERIKTVSEIINPFVTIVMGIFVAFIISALFSIITTMQKAMSKI